MPCCCVKTLNLCNVPICGTLELDKAAISESPNGLIYKLIIDFLETQITISKEQAEGEKISFDISALNENFQFTAQVFDGAGNLVSFEYNGETYDCIKFKTVQSVAV